MGDTTERRWSATELATLVAAKRADLSWNAAAEQLPGRTSYQCQKKWSKRVFWLGDDDEIIAAAPGTFSVASKLNELHARDIPPHVFADRAARERAEARRSIAAAFLNEPPPGYSALDRKQSSLMAPAFATITLATAPFRA